MITAAPVKVVYGPPCEECGHVRETRYTGLPSDVAEMLRAAFEMSRLSKAELSRRAGLHEGGNHVGKMLRGESRPSRPTAVALIRALDMSWADGVRLLEASGSGRDRRARRAHVS